MSRRFLPARPLVLAAAALVTLGACAAEEPDRSAAVDAVLARYEGRLTREQAACYVDRVIAELGVAALEAERPAPEQIARLTRIRVDCAGVVSLGTSLPPTSRAVRPGGGTAPQRPGDDAALDELHAACAAGAGSACDDLFAEAPIGSEYEDFALTCGGRTSEPRCADRYIGEVG